MKALAEIPAETALAVQAVEKPEKQLAQYIQKKLKGGQVIVDYWLGVMENSKARDADRLKASELLASRGWGKPKEVLTIEAGNGLEALSLETLISMAAAWDHGKTVEGEFTLIEGGGPADTSSG